MPRTDAAREAALRTLLDDVVAGRLHQPARDHGADDGWVGSLEVVRLLLALRWPEAVALARSLPPVNAHDAEGRWLRRGATTWATAGDPSPASAHALVGHLDDLPDLATTGGWFAAYLMVEGALMHARLDLAVALAERVGPALWDGLDHPFDALVRVCRVRLLAFAGDIAGAGAALGDVREAPPGPLTAVLAGTNCLVRGNTAEPAEVRRLVALVDEHAGCADDMLGAGAQMLAAFGLIALNEVTAAAGRVLTAGGDADLERLGVADRGLGLEMLTVFALAADDLDTALTWVDRVLPLLASPIADSTVARTLSRLALAEGRVDEAVAWAERAVARAAETGRLIEQAEGEIVLNRARLQLGGEGDRARAVKALEDMVIAAEARGHAVARRAAARELRPIGVRLRPLAGSGWAGLSSREAEVARLVVSGATNRQVAARLHVSEHTVRAHVSRVLAAFGVATRAGLPAVAGGDGPAGVRPPLTPRQDEVARLVGEGLSNREIATRLGLSTRTVEKHVGDILLRWDLAGRTAIAGTVQRSRPA